MRLSRGFIQIVAVHKRGKGGLILHVLSVSQAFDLDLEFAMSVHFNLLSLRLHIEMLIPNQTTRLVKEGCLF